MMVMNVTKTSRSRNVTKSVTVFIVFPKGMISISQIQVHHCHNKRCRHRYYHQRFYSLLSNLGTSGVAGDGVILCGDLWYQSHGSPPRPDHAKLLKVNFIVGYERYKRVRPSDQSILSPSHQ